MGEKLEGMAAEMRTLLQGSQAQWVQRRLPRGLEIVLQRKGERWRLALARPDVWPSDDEIANCLRAFKLLDLVEEQHRLPAKGRQPYYVVEMCWREAEVVA